MGFGEELAFNLPTAWLHSKNEVQSKAPLASKEKNEHVPHCSGKQAEAFSKIDILDLEEEFDCEDLPKVVSHLWGWNNNPLPEDMTTSLEPVMSISISPET